jgi:hypothetical protein
LFNREAKATPRRREMSKYQPKAWGVKLDGKVEFKASGTREGRLAARAYAEALHRKYPGRVAIKAIG